MSLWEGHELNVSGIAGGPASRSVPGVGSITAVKGAEDNTHTGP